jgi:hypothetical protein
MRHALCPRSPRAAPALLVASRLWFPAERLLLSLGRRRGAAVAARAPRKSAGGGSSATLDKEAEKDDSLAAARKRALEDAMAEINAQYGKGTVTRLGAVGVSPGVETFPSGSLALDYVLGGGLPRGRIVEVSQGTVGRPSVQGGSLSAGPPAPVRECPPPGVTRTPVFHRVSAHCRVSSGCPLPWLCLLPWAERGRGVRRCMARRAAARPHWRCTRWRRSRSRGATAC